MIAKPTPDTRNRVAEARASGGKMLCIALPADSLAAMDAVQAHLTATLGRCSQAQAIGYALLAARKKLPK